MRLRPLLPLLLAGAAFADTFTPPSAVREVTVYADRAIVTRSATLEMPAGEHTVVFDKLPAGLIEKTLQVAGVGDGVTLADVDLRRTDRTVEEPAAIAELRKKLDEIAAEDGGIANKIKTGQRAIEVLGSMETAWVSATSRDAGEGKSAPRPFTPDECRQFLAFGEEQRLKSLENLRELEKQRTALSKKRDKLNRELSEALTKERAAGRVAKVTLRLIAEKPAKLTLDLGYAVGGASWTPGYDARLDTAARRLRLTYFGNVANGTGEDWSGVKLKLSTARPGLAAQVPLLAPVAYGVPRPAEVAKTSSFEIGAARAPASKSAVYQNHFQQNGVNREDTYSGAFGGAGNAPADAPMSFAAAQVESAGVAATFVSPVAAQLPADGTPHRIALGETDLPVELRYEIVPALSESAFLTGKLKNATDYTFVAGPVSVFINGGFVADSRIETLTPGGVLTLSFGKDDAVTVRRKPVESFTENTGITGKYLTTTKTWRTVVTNTRRTTETLLVREVLPVSEHEKIEITPLSPAKDAIVENKPGAPHDLSPQGILTSTYTFAPGEKRELVFAYKIERPRDLATNIPE